MGGRSPRCTEDGCEYPIYRDDLGLCIEHVLHPIQLDPPPVAAGPEPQSRPVSRAGSTPKEKT